ncbi:hypothetical protein RvY_08974-2 [Ramazzottius varieornatus]|uniref:Uncharacterized protein n=1 Tax=Ramazzottius varieornatus TaxID=947166 RepID=A0A1D1VGX4_RAMVA|nr:hypothetical protein RvY_08974-2 [Ramazzottius varieornatus]
MDQQVTLKQWVMQHKRSGHLDRLDKPIVRRLFAETPLAQLRKFLAYFSVTKTSSLSQKKAMDMCFTRFYRGSESSRQQALEIFKTCRGCVDYLDRPLQTVRDEIRSELGEVQLLGSQTDGSFSNAIPDSSSSADEMDTSINRTVEQDTNGVGTSYFSVTGCISTLCQVFLRTFYCLDDNRSEQLGRCDACKRPDCATSSSFPIPRTCWGTYLVN